MKNQCLRGHPRVSENLTPNGTCKLCRPFWGWGSGPHRDNYDKQYRAQQRILEGSDFKVYALVDPRGPEIFYVGCTISPRNRLRQHIRNRGRVVNSSLGHRIAEMKAENFRPSMVVLERTKYPQREQFWIEYLRPYGLLNSDTPNPYRGMTFPS